ncbi:MAG: hypothetical protein ACI4SB_10640 [Acutalibacteraceae bacterium]
MMPKKMIRIISIILAGLMVLSVVAVLVNVFAADTSTILPVVSTGDNDLDYIVPIALIAVAAVAVVLCLVLPKIKKKKDL